MKQIKILKIFLLTIYGFALFFGAAIENAQGLERDGRWLKYNGTYPYLVGYDVQELFSKKPYYDANGIEHYSYADMDYKLKQLQDYGVSAIRVWANTWFMGNNGYYPWTRDANGKFNLNSWDLAYWQRMRDFVQKCKDRNIIVEFVIFAEYPSMIDWWKDPNMPNAWYKGNNYNNVFSLNGQGHFYPQFFDLNHQENGITLKYHQQRLIDKSIYELNSFGNVYFQVHNEFPTRWEHGSEINNPNINGWQQYWADYIGNTKQAIVVTHAHEGSGMHLYGTDLFQDKSYVDVLNFHYYSACPDSWCQDWTYIGQHHGADNIKMISDMLHGLQGKGKILQCDESHKYEDATYTEAVTREAWASFVSGAYYFHYTEDMDNIGLTDAWKTLAERIKVLRNVSKEVSFWLMSPVDSNGNEYDSLISQAPSAYWQVLANPGNEYVAYFTMNPSSTAVKISLPSGTYNYKYYDARAWNNGVGIKNGSIISTGGIVIIQAPSTGSWSGSVGIVLVIKKAFDSADVNQDTKINVQDIQACVNVILGMETTPAIVARTKAVVTDLPENVCNVLDLQAIVNEILK